MDHGVQQKHACQRLLSGWFSCGGASVDSDDKLLMWQVHGFCSRSRKCFLMVFMFCRRESERCCVHMCIVHCAHTVYECMNV